MDTIHNFSDFCAELLTAGFSLASGGNNEGVFGLLEYNWDNQPPDSTIRWHTGDAEHDPWEWRIRVLDERDDIAYGKVFFRKAGYITKEWYPYFLAARRGGQSFEDAYADGLYSHYAKRIYDVLQGNGAVPLDEIKQMGGFGKDDKSRFDKTVTDLQMGLYVTLCGRRQKISAKGAEYGWASTTLCTIEEFWGDDVFARAAKVSVSDAATAITERVYQLNPNAVEKKIAKFIFGK
jgi:hypothetical protein